MPEEGTLSIVRQGTGYQIRYASNNPHDQERLPHACSNEVHLAAFLHHVGTEVTVIAQVCAEVRQGKLVVLLVGLSAEQLQACFPPTPQGPAGRRAVWPANIASPGAAVVRHDSHRSASLQPRSQPLWSQAREVRGTAETQREEFALLLEEAALLLEETALAMGKSHQLLAQRHA